MTLFNLLLQPNFSECTGGGEKTKHLTCWTPSELNAVLISSSSWFSSATSSVLAASASSILWISPLFFICCSTSTSSWKNKGEGVNLNVYIKYTEELVWNCDITEAVHQKVVRSLPGWRIRSAQFFSSSQNTMLILIFNDVSAQWNWISHRTPSRS